MTAGMDHRLYLKMDDASSLPPTVHKWSQNILDTKISMLHNRIQIPHIEVTLFTSSCNTVCIVCDSTRLVCVFVYRFTPDIKMWPLRSNLTSPHCMQINTDIVSVCKGAKKRKGRAHCFCCCLLLQFKELLSAPASNTSEVTGDRLKKTNPRKCLHTAPVVSSTMSIKAMLQHIPCVPLGESLCATWEDIRRHLG